MSFLATKARGAASPNIFLADPCCCSRASQLQAKGGHLPVLLCSRSTAAPSRNTSPLPAETRPLAPTARRGELALPFGLPLKRTMCNELLADLLHCSSSPVAALFFFFFFLTAQPRKHAALVGKALTCHFLYSNFKFQLNMMS